MFLCTNVALRAFPYVLEKVIMNIFMLHMHIFSCTYTVSWTLYVPTNIIQCKYIYDRLKEYRIYFRHIKFVTVVWIDLFVCISDTNPIQYSFFCVSKLYLLLQKKYHHHNIQVKILTHTLPLRFSFGYIRQVSVLEVVYPILY